MQSANTILFEMISKLRAALATSKIPALLELVEQYEDANEPIVVFSDHRGVLPRAGKKRSGAAAAAAAAAPSLRTKTRSPRASAPSAPVKKGGGLMSRQPGARILALFDYLSTRARKEAVMADKKLVLIRGLPGSGKSTLARQMVDEHRTEHGSGSAAALSTDDYFNADGIYVWVKKELAKAHAWNTRRIEKLMERGVELLVVDNTHTQLWQAAEAAKLAIQHGYQLSFAYPDTEWRSSPEECFKRNRHGVGLDDLTRMLQEFEQVPDVENIAEYLTALPKPWERVCTLKIEETTA